MVVENVVQYDSIRAVCIKKKKNSDVCVHIYMSDGGGGGGGGMLYISLTCSSF